MTKYIFILSGLSFVLSALSLVITAINVLNHQGFVDTVNYDLKAVWKRIDKLSGFTKNLR